MGARWRRPFCTSVRRDPVDADVSEAVKRNMSPRIRAKFVGLFPGTGGGGGGGSKPSTPAPLHCRTTTKAAAAASPYSLAQAPATARPCTYNPPPPLPSAAIPVRRASSEPSSPRSPSRFALLMASLRLSSRSRCGLCTQSVKIPGGDNGGGGSAAVFTAECSHTFHLSCIASRGSLVCPVCSATWRNSPLLSSVLLAPPPPAEHRKSVVTPRRNADNGRARGDGQPKKTAAPAAKVYNDDEPLLPSRGCAVRFNAIPEAEDEEEDEDNSNSNNNLSSQGSSFCGLPRSMDRLLTIQAGSGYHGGVELSVLPEAALVSAGRSHRNYVVAVKVKAPTEFRDGRAPIDLVTVLDVRGSMTGPKLHMLKRAMRQLIASLGPVDRLSIVAFSSTAAKRLLSLHRMSRQGQRYAVQVVDRLIVSTAAQGAGPATGASDALKKAAKVLEDRRERNPVATIMLLSDAQQQQKSKADAKKDHRDGAAAMRFAHVDIPIHASGLGDGSAEKASDQDPFIQCVLSGLMRNSVMRDVYLQLAFPAAEISSVYSNSGGRAVALGGGGTVRLGDLRAGEERMLLVELRVPATDRPHHNCMMIFRCSYSGAGEQMIRCQEQPLAMPPLQGCSNQRLRNLFVATRAVAESRHLAELNDLATAVHLLSSARALLLQSPSDKHLLLSLEAELSELQQRRRVMMQSHSPCGVSRVGGQAQALLSSAVDDGREPLTPTSAWRAAERLAKLAIMRKSMNRVSDLHGFENARF